MDFLIILLFNNLNDTAFQLNYFPIIFAFCRLQIFSLENVEVMPNDCQTFVEQITECCESSSMYILQIFNHLFAQFIQVFIFLFFWRAFWLDFLR